MNRRISDRHVSRSFRNARWLVAGILFAGAVARGQETSEGRPLLEQLNRETQALYRDVRMGVVRMQLPAPRWVNDYAAQTNPLRKWQGLDPEVRRTLGDPSRRITAGDGPARPGPTTARAGAEESVRDRIGQATIILMPPIDLRNMRNPILGGMLQMDRNAGGFTPNNLGLLLDDKGHVLVPLYLERETIGGQAVKVALNGGDVAEAKFVGSDRQTNLTVLRLDKPLGKPARLGEDRPADGSLVLYISPSDGSGRLGIWTGGAQEYGLVFFTDGRVAGIARYGQFLSGSACRLIAEQIVRFGAVKRATLGVLISEIRKDDPLRQQAPILGNRTAMRIDQVIPGSAADRAGLRQGDLLLALAGDAVNDIPSLAAAIASRSGKTQLQVLRGTEVVDITVDLQQK